MDWLEDSYCSISTQGGGKMKIGIIGGGSIGLLMSAKLGEQHDVTIYVRSQQQKQSIHQYGIGLSQQPNPYFVKARVTEELGGEDCFIVCVKQPQLLQVLPLLTAYVKQMPVIFLQNGMGHINQLTDVPFPVLLGIVEHGALRENDHQVTHTGEGVMRLAALNGERTILKTMVGKLNRPDFSVQKEDDWLRMLQEKLVINAVINPLTALFAVTNGTINHNPHITTIAKELCREASGVLGLDFPEQWSRVQTVADQTEGNESSMWKDIKEGRQSENDAISGYLLHHAKQDIPYTAFAYHSIKALEMKRAMMV